MRVKSITIGNSVVDVQITVRNNETALAKHVFVIIIIIYTIHNLCSKIEIVFVVYSLTSE